jgi:hypothetical protein
MRIGTIVGLIFLGVLCRCANAQQMKVLSAQKITKLVPSKISGYYLKGVARSSEMKIGTLTYSLCERNFANGKRQIRILLFDYINAPIMYQQSMKNHANMTPIESDSIIYKPIELGEAKGWESVNRMANESKLILGIYDRYYLSIDGENVDFDEVVRVFNLIDLKKFPH